MKSFASKPPPQNVTSWRQYLQGFVQKLLQGFLQEFFKRIIQELQQKILSSEYLQRFLQRNLNNSSIDSKFVNMYLYVYQKSRSVLSRKISTLWVLRNISSCIQSSIYPKIPSEILQRFPYNVSEYFCKNSSNKWFMNFPKDFIEIPSRFPIRIPSVVSPSMQNILERFIRNLFRNSNSSMNSIRNLSYWTPLSISYGNSSNTNSSLKFIQEFLW